MRARRGPDDRGNYCAAVQWPDSKRKGHALLLDAVLVAIAALVILVPCSSCGTSTSGSRSRTPRQPGHLHVPAGRALLPDAHQGRDRPHMVRHQRDPRRAVPPTAVRFPREPRQPQSPGVEGAGCCHRQRWGHRQHLLRPDVRRGAASMLLVLHTRWVCRRVAFVIALLYTYLPYHFAPRPTPLPLFVLGRPLRRLPRPEGRVGAAAVHRSRSRAAGGGSGSGIARACSGCSRVSRSRRRAPTTQLHADVHRRAHGRRLPRAATHACSRRAAMRSPRSGSSCCSTRRRTSCT